MALFRNRRDAGIELVRHLAEYDSARDAIVLALPRGGVPIGYEVALALHLPLDVYLVRKLGVPGHEELAMGALASDGTYVVDETIVDYARVDRATFEATLERETRELQRRAIAYRDDRPEPHLANVRLIVVDDGLATGATMEAAVTALRTRRPKEIVVAVPVAASESIQRLRASADRVICPHELSRFGAVGFHYEDFSEVSDDDVRALLSRAEMERVAWSAA